MQLGDLRHPGLCQFLQHTLGAILKPKVLNDRLEQPGCQLVIPRDPMWVPECANIHQLLDNCLLGVRQQPFPENPAAVLLMRQLHLIAPCCRLEVPSLLFLFAADEFCLKSLDF
jgi:hypothetical protein